MFIEGYQLYVVNTSDELTFLDMYFAAYEDRLLTKTDFYLRYYWIPE